MKKKRYLLSFALLVALSGCGNETSKESDHSEMDHGGSHSSSGEIPKGLKDATNPTFKVGSVATITTDHMKGMKDAEATIVGAYDTTVYTISYTPTTGGEKVEDHKWIIHEEIKDAATEPYAEGDEVIVEGDHTKGMKGVTAVIDSAEETTVYMVDYTSTDGEEVKNHKWVTESELSAD